MSPVAAQRLRWLASAISVLALVALLAGGWFYWRVRASLPALDGAAAVRGLGAAVKIERDALGVPTIRGESRTDVARALGWLHGQDRFFQMDLLRRSAAGELAELFGKRALPRDRAKRMHGFRQLAQTVLAASPAEHRALLDAYAAGVNAGLGALGEKPFEYLVLRETPQPWRPEDTFLVACAMTMDLQDETGRYERTLMTLRDRLGSEALAFFAPLSGPDDAALDGSAGSPAPIPSAREIDLRPRADRKTVNINAHPSAERFLAVASADEALARAAAENFPFPPRAPGAVIGSNAFALSGAHTASGVALLANDMHLDHAVPNIWYRATLEFPGHKITGVTLPGTPLVIAGSNGRVAWGFTNSYADTGDLVVVDLNSIAHSMYAAPGEPRSREIEKRKDTIRVKGDDPVAVEYEWTIWGPIVGVNEKKRPLAYRWIAHDPAATNLNLIGLEDAANVAEAVVVAHRAGIPAQNFIAADSAGAIAWTIAGVLPRRVGYDGRLPVSWAFGDRRWDGFLPASEVPVILFSGAGRDSGRLWSANQRSLGGAGLATIGDGAYARPARAAQIRDDLAPLEKATPRDLLAVQLDDRALFLARWQKLLLDTLAPAATAQKKNRAELRALAEKWEGRATVDSVSYALVREFRTAVYARVFRPIFESCFDDYPDFRMSELHLEDALWTMVREKPAHLLNPQFSSWEEVLVAAADDVIAKCDKQGVPLARATWGRRNTSRIRHPLASALPGFLAGWLNLPATPLPGDDDMPRVHGPIYGASERLVVSPGREAEGIFHMPGGQSAHPLSPFFRAGHEAWVRGEATAFLPGKTEHTLTLMPGP